MQLFPSPFTLARAPAALRSESTTLVVKQEEHAAFRYTVETENKHADTSGSRQRKITAH